MQCSSECAGSMHIYAPLIAVFLFSRKISVYSSIGYLYGTQPHSNMINSFDDILSLSL